MHRATSGRCCWLAQETGRQGKREREWRLNLLPLLLQLSRENGITRQQHNLTHTRQQSFPIDSLIQPVGCLSEMARRFALVDPSVFRERDRRRRRRRRSRLGSIKRGDCPLRCRYHVVVVADVIVAAHWSFVPMLASCAR